jgi:lactate dehydrogenase-like 2-hydroxyacid dehydrogenase
VVIKPVCAIKNILSIQWIKEISMTTKVGINGFGRIGRQVLKAIRDYYPDELEVVAFNDIGDLPTMAHL